jgi:hypothetical protein
LVIQLASLPNRKEAKRSSPMRLRIKSKVSLTAHLIIVENLDLSWMMLRLMEPELENGDRTGTWGSPD